MAIKLKNGAEFLHIPKTGGTWVTEILEQLDLIDRHIGGHKHVDYDRLLYFTKNIRSGREYLKEAMVRASRKLRRGFLKGRNEETVTHNPIRFCFVRHPLTWYESWWKYMSGRGWNDWGTENSAGDWHPNSILNGLGSDDFNEFV